MKTIIINFSKKSKRQTITAYIIRKIIV